jgi:hypothetical protein
MPTNHSTSSAMLRPSLALLTSGPPQRASIPVLALEAQPPRGLPSRPTSRGAGQLQVLKTRGFSGNSRQAGPVRPVYNADQSMAAKRVQGFQLPVPITNRRVRRTTEGQAFANVAHAGGTRSSNPLCSSSESAANSSASARGTRKRPALRGDPQRHAFSRTASISCAAVGSRVRT